MGISARGATEINEVEIKMTIPRMLIVHGMLGTRVHPVAPMQIGSTDSVLRIDLCIIYLSLIHI